MLSHHMLTERFTEEPWVNRTFDVADALRIDRSLVPFLKGLTREGYEGVVGLALGVPRHEIKRWRAWARSEEVLMLMVLCGASGLGEESFAVLPDGGITRARIVTTTIGSTKGVHLAFLGSVEAAFPIAERRLKTTSDRLPTIPPAYASRPVPRVTAEDLLARHGTAVGAWVAPDELMRVTTVTGLLHRVFDAWGTGALVALCANRFPDPKLAGRATPAALITLGSLCGRVTRVRDDGTLEVAVDEDPDLPRLDLLIARNGAWRRFPGPIA